ncbi:MAG: CAP domain-containing protein [Oscillospiraceae bacterium]|nr:CAP domain-containing protein [Oscillospiraceae bacterium]
MKRLALLAVGIITAFAVVMAIPGVKASAAKVYLSETSVTLEVGESCSISLKGASSGKITWKNYTPSVCRYKNGKITAVGVGEGYVKAEYNGKTYKCTVTVTGDETSDTSNTSDSDKKITLKAGKTYSYTVSVPDNTDISTSNSNSNAVSVKNASISKGSVTLKLSAKQAGTATIELSGMSDGKKLAEIKVVVSSDDYSISDVTEDTDKYVDKVIELVNAEREKYGLDPLTKDESLCASAEIRTGEIGEKFSHIRPDGTPCYTVIDISYTSCAENIAHGQDNPESVVSAWMSSAGHRGNILSSAYTKIGVAYDADEEVWVQIFVG